MLITSRNRTRNNQWRSCIIDQNRIHLIHHGKVQFTLNQTFWVQCHIVTQVVETKFIIGTKCDISQVSFTSFFRIWLMLIDTING